MKILGGSYKNSVCYCFTVARCYKIKLPLYVNIFLKPFPAN